MHSTCIAAFRTQNRRRFKASHGAAFKSGRAHSQKLTAMVEGDIHQCLQRQASGASVPAFYTLCGYLVPSDNVEQTCHQVTCPECLRRAGQQAAH